MYDAYVPVVKSSLPEVVEPMRDSTIDEIAADSTDATD